jgi:hypothetical protein
LSPPPLIGYDTRRVGVLCRVKDAATHFFPGYNRQGVYVVECRYRVDRKGTIK